MEIKEETRDGAAHALFIKTGTWTDVRVLDDNGEVVDLLTPRPEREIVIADEVKWIFFEFICKGNFDPAPKRDENHVQIIDGTKNKKGEHRNALIFVGGKAIYEYDGEIGRINYQGYGSTVEDLPWSDVHKLPDNVISKDRLAHIVDCLTVADVFEKASALNEKVVRYKEEIYDIASQYQHIKAKRGALLRQEVTRRREIKRERRRKIEEKAIVAPAPKFFGYCAGACGDIITDFDDVLVFTDGLKYHRRCFVYAMSGGRVLC